MFNCVLTGQLFPQLESETVSSETSLPETMLKSLYLLWEKPESEGTLLKHPPGETAAIWEQPSTILLELDPRRVSGTSALSWAPREPAGGRW